MADFKNASQHPKIKSSAFSRDEPDGLEEGEIAINTGNTPPTLYVGAENGRVIQVPMIGSGIALPGYAAPGSIFLLTSDAQDRFFYNDGFNWVPFGSGGSGGGEVNTSSNEGGGVGLAMPKSGFNLPFKTLLAGTNVTLDQTVNTVAINATGGSGGVPEAPNDGKQYGRQDLSWTEIVGGGGGTSIDVPVVQSASFSGKLGASVAVLSSTEPGWSVTRTATGTFDITFPTAANSAEEQVIQVQWFNQDVPGVYEMSPGVWNQTTTSCTVTISSDTGVEADEDFSIIRRLPDRTVSVSGSGGGGVTSQVRVPIATASVVGGAFEFTNIPAGYDYLVIDGDARSDGTGTGGSSSLAVHINGDTTPGNYWRQNAFFYDNQGNEARANDDQSLFIAAADSPAGHSRLSIEFADYDSTGTAKSWRSTFFVKRTSTSGLLHGNVMSSNNIITDPITSIRIAASTQGAPASGTLTLYGVQDAAAVGGGGSNLIATLTPDGNGDIVYTVPTGYDRIVLRGSLLSNYTSSNVDNARIFFNGDETLANYSSQNAGGSGGASLHTANVNDCRILHLATQSAQADQTFPKTRFEITIDEPDVSQMILVQSYYVQYRTLDTMIVNHAAVSKNGTSPDTVQSFKLTPISGTALIGTVYVFGETY